MSQTDIFDRLKNYIASDVLEGNDVGLDASTALLDLGVLNSLEITKLVNFIEATFGVSIPLEAVLAENFKDLAAITDLIVTLERTIPGGS